MAEHQHLSQPRGQMISARLIAPTLRVSEYQLPADHLHLMVVINGELEISGASSQQSVPNSSLIYLPKGKTRSMRLGAGTRIAWVKINEIGLAHAMPSSLDTHNLRQLLARSIIKPLAISERNLFLQDIETIATETTGLEVGSDAIASSLVSILLVRLWRKAMADRAVSSSSQGTLLEAFVQLALEHKHDHWPIEQYCLALQTSRERLQTAVFRATGMSPQAYLHRSIIMEACDLLQNTSLQINEIAFRLGYQDPAYFNRFFTRSQGISPGRYRKKALDLHHNQPPSFAAWP